MSKFKAGDRVRLVDSEGLHPVVAGATGTVRHDPNYPEGEMTSVTWDRNILSGSQSDGAYFTDRFELIEPEGPVRTVTRREIVPGVYGTVGVQSVFDGKVGVYVPAKNHSPTELRDAARIFNELADALEEAGA